MSLKDSNLILIKALALFPNGQKATIYYSGPPQDSHLFYKKPRDLLVEGGPPVQGRRPQCSSRQCKSPPTNVFLLTCRPSRTFFTIKRKIFILAEMPVVMDKRLTDKIVRYFATQPIVKAWVFGSYARGEAHSGSDIDILVVFDKEAKVSFDMDLITEGTLLSFAERTADNDKILIHERAS